MLQASSYRAAGILALSMAGMALVWITFAGQYAKSNMMDSQCSTTHRLARSSPKDSMVYSAELYRDLPGTIVHVPCEGGGIFSVQTG